jgi:hypothetical protein
VQRARHLSVLFGRELGKGGYFVICPLPHSLLVDSQVDGSEIETVEFAEWSSSCWHSEHISSWPSEHDTSLSLRLHFFSVTRADVPQVLILSYEMFRKHSAALNATPLLDIIICDEAHRLKNVTGTKTMRALRFWQEFYWLL